MCCVNICAGLFRSGWLLFSEKRKTVRYRFQCMRHLASIAPQPTRRSDTCEFIFILYVILLYMFTCITGPHCKTALPVVLSCIDVFWYKNNINGRTYGRTDGRIDGRSETNIPLNNFNKFPNLLAPWTLLSGDIRFFLYLSLLFCLFWGQNISKYACFSLNCYLIMQENSVLVSEMEFHK